MVKKVLHIEGTSVTINGDLKKSFQMLFQQKLGNKLPKIQMCNSRADAIKSFNNNEANNKFLLIDLDMPENNKDEALRLLGFESNSNLVHFMVQEMESWFISQAPTVIDKRFDVLISQKIPKKKATEFSEPDKQIAEWLRPYNKKYHKVKDASFMLKLLNLEKLMQDFPDVKNLVEELAKP
jgi:hypothetical protein